METFVLAVKVVVMVAEVYLVLAGKVVVMVAEAEFVLDGKVVVMAAVRWSCLLRVGW